MNLTGDPVPGEMKMHRVAVILAVFPGTLAAGEKSVLEPGKEEDPDPSPPSWCEWLDDNPGRLFRDKKNPWIQSIEFSGRFQFQAAYLDGNDVNGRDFHDTYDEYRRVRLGTEIEFLRYFSTEAEISLVEDNRFEDGDLRWGYDRFTEASLEFDVGRAFGSGWFDGIDLRYGRSKLRMSFFNDTATTEIYTVERSSLAERVSGGIGRPTGITLELDKEDWELNLGMFSGEEEEEFLAGWNAGRFYYASLEWDPKGDWEFLWDNAWNDQKGEEDFLGYSWATVLSVNYDDDRWGVLTQLFYGDNGGAPSASDPSREGVFRGGVIMPWYWIVEDKLQAVLQYEYASASRSQGFQLRDRYLRGGHQDPFVDVDNGRGDELHSIYLGLNYHLCGDHLKLMGGISYEDLKTEGDDVEGVTYMFALRSYF